MARSPQDRSRFRGWNALTWGRAEPETEGLVLSGGGSRTSFQIGALKYLYQRAGIEPTVMVGTSAGSILVAMLAQFADPKEQAKAVELLEELWCSMRTQSDMFTERVWFRTLRERGQEWYDLIEAKELLKPKAPSSWSANLSLPRIQIPFVNREGESEEATAPEREPTPLSPQAKVLAMATSDEQPSAPAWSPSIVMQLMSVLPQLRGAPAELGRIWRGAEASRSMYHPGPILAELLDEENFQAPAVADSGIITRIATVALESGQLRFMTQDGTLVDREDRPVPGTTAHDLSRGVLASCSIPAVFPPVEIDGEYYVDGGVRENVPVELAVSRLGVRRAYVVTSAPTDPQPAGSFATKSMFSIAFRATELLTEETERDELAYADRAGAMVISPQLDVHSSLTIDPGLTRINIDYGWLRAAEQHLNLGPIEQGLHRQLIELRLRAHRIESEHFLGEQPTMEAALRELALVKLEIRTVMDRMRSELLPEGSRDWWADFEQHPTELTSAPTWLTPDED